MKHISYSQHSSYSKCSRSWYLSKIRQAPERPAWYTIIGSSVHEMIEFHLNNDGLDDYQGPDSFTAEDYFHPLVLKAMEREPDTDQWMHSLDGDGVPLVKERALEFVKVAFDRALTFLEDIDVWEVEYNASGHLPGCEPEIKAFVDIIGEHRKHGPVILDWKTGKHKDPFQLETYAALLKQPGDMSVRPPEGFKGYFAMLAPWAPQSRYKDLSGVDPAAVGAKYQATWEKMQARFVKPTNAEAVCGFCFQKENCLVRSEDRERAEFYDKSDDWGLPF